MIGIEPRVGVGVGLIIGIIALIVRKISLIEIISSPSTILTTTTTTTAPVVSILVASIVKVALATSTEATSASATTSASTTTIVVLTHGGVESTTGTIYGGALKDCLGDRIGQESLDVTS